MLINKKTDNDLDIIIMKALTGKEFMTIYKNDLKYVCKKLIDIFTSGGKILICGNGGSAADADHIAAEYIKDFKIKRKRRDFNILQQNDVCSRLQPVSYTHLELM